MAYGIGLRRPGGSVTYRERILRDLGRFMRWVEDQGDRRPCLRSSVATAEKASGAYEASGMDGWVKEAYSLVESVVVSPRIISVIRGART